MGLDQPPIHHLQPLRDNDHLDVARRPHLIRSLIPIGHVGGIVRGHRGPSHEGLHQPSQGIRFQECRRPMVEDA